MVKSGEIYKHYKGNTYGVITTAKHCDTDEIYVVYKNLETSEVYIRNIKDFEGESHNCKRFVLIDEVEIRV